ncbi:MAG: FtsX-like permease family protein [Longimicrobiales bacterium]
MATASAEAAVAAANAKTRAAARTPGWRFEWYVARRYLASRRRGRTRFLSLITVIAVGGVALGVTALVTVIAVMTGLQNELQRMILGSTPHVYVFEAGQAFRLDGWGEVMPEIRAVPGVTAAAPFVMTQVGVIRPGAWTDSGGSAGAGASTAYARAGQLYGITVGAADEPMTAVEEDIRSGELAFGPTVSGLPGVLVGSGLAQHLSVLPGDTVVLAALENLKFDPLGNPVPSTGEFEVAGVFQTGMYEYDNNNLYVELERAQNLLDFPPGTVSGIAVNTVDPWTADGVSSALFETLGPSYFVDNWRRLNAALFEALKLEKIAMQVILFLIVIVAAFNIISTLIMVVTDKTREIGILKSMGMTDGAVLRVFLLQGLAIGMIGTALGAVGGVTLVTLIDRYRFITLPGDVYFIDRLPVALDLVDFALIIVISLLIALVATIHPARQASRLQPVDAIRHE